MSQAALKYVISLGRRVTRRQQHFLMVLAFHHQANRYTFWPTQQTLAEEALSDVREVKRMTVECRELGILAVTSGLGKGNVTEYSFPELEKGVNLPSFEDEETAAEPAKEGKSTPLSEAKGGAKGGTKGGKYATPNKERQITNTKSSSRELLTAGKLGKQDPIVSSSSNDQDDDALKIDRIIQAFESNPMTCGKASAADRAIARELLQKFTPEQIEFGILIGSARKAQSLANGAPEVRVGRDGKLAENIQSLRYFLSVVDEAATATLAHGDDYGRYCRRVVERFIESLTDPVNKKPVQGVAS